MGDHGGGDFLRQGGGEGAFPGVGSAGRFYQSEAGNGDGGGPGDVEHGAFGQGEDGMVAGEEQLELLHSFSAISDTSCSTAAQSGSSLLSHLPPAHTTTRRYLCPVRRVCISLLF